MFEISGKTRVVTFYLCVSAVKFLPLTDSSVAITLIVISSWLGKSGCCVFIVLVTYRNRVTTRSDVSNVLCVSQMSPSKYNHRESSL